jgi:hypothetical protein
MKNKLKLALLVITSTLLFSNCKKGQEDPVFSLRTRKARLAGEWRMVSGNASLTQLIAAEPPFNQNFAFNGTKATINETESGGPAIIYTATYNLNLTIKKDGTFNFRENFAGDVLDVSGHWDFNTGVGDAKRKEEITLKLETITGGITKEHIFNKLRTEFTYKLVELRNKELKMESATKLYLGDNGDKVTYTSEYSFIQS